ncbi:MAG: hypothetical protein BRD40_00460, partial [Bacteroidetes bacterium QS_1_65_9]
EATLSLAPGLTEEERKRWRLPPAGPGGAFDVRFAGGFQAAKAGSEGTFRSIETQGLETPVTVGLASPGESGQSVRLRHGGEATRLTRESPSVELRSAEDLAVGLQSVPEEFALKKPYPNPARGQATLAYALPEQSEVRITVYDVLGRRVATLVEGRKKAGTYRATLEASQLPSGTYFARVRAEGFRQTRRLTVVR